MSGVVVQTLAVSYMTWRTDWDEQVNEKNQLVLMRLMVDRSFYVYMTLKSYSYQIIRLHSSSCITSCKVSYVDYPQSRQLTRQQLISSVFPLFIQQFFHRLCLMRALIYMKRSGNQNFSAS